MTRTGSLLIQIKLHPARAGSVNSDEAGRRPFDGLNQ